MKTKSRNLIISFLITLAMLFSVFAISPMTASALSITPTPEETPAETVYVGGVELSKGQYVMNGETTAVTGEPAADASGFAYYTSDGLLFLVDYEYEGTGYTHDISEKSVIYSEGKLEIILFGTSSIKNSADKSIWTANGIRAKGNLIIDGPGTITINAPYAIYGNNLVKFEYGRTVIPSATVAIEAGGNFIVNGGYVELHSTQPIEAAASFISGGSFTATAEQGVFKAAPTISVDTEDVYWMELSYNVDGSNPQAYIPENITQYKYFAVLPPTPTEIDSISVSDVDVPEVGDSLIELDLYEATYGENYYLDSWGLEVYVGGRWIEAEGLSEVTDGLKYRFILWICPEEGYDISADISGDDISFNGGQVTEFKLNEYPDYNELEIYYEFHYGELIDPLITSIEISGLTLPVAGQTADSWPFDPSMLTFGGNYDFGSCGMQEYNGTEWVLMEGDTILTGVRYRFAVVLRADEGYFFSPELTSDDVTIGDDDAVLVKIDPTGEYAVVAAEFYYDEASSDGYGIIIADKDESGATVGVEITSENCTDVLGDGTVSYDPATNTLTLNNYVYNGEGCLVDDGGYMAIMADIPAEGLTIVLVGANSITVSGGDSAGMVFFEEGDLTVKGNGSLSINSIMYGITLQTDSGKLTTENAKLNITTTGAMAIGIQATDFVMNSGDLKITASMIGIGTSKEAGICINGGSVEIGTATGGYAFIYLDFEHLSFNPIKPDLSGYVGAYKMTAGVNQDGSDATDFNEGYLTSYKYVKIAHAHTHGTEYKNDATNHWNECACGDKTNVAPHADTNNDQKCDTCGYEIPAQAPGTDPGNTPGDPNGDKDGLGTGAIVGIVIGSVLVAGIGGFALVWFVIKKKTWAEFLAIFKKK